MWLFVIQDTVLFLGLIAATIYIRTQSGSAIWLRSLDLGSGIINTIVLTLSGYTMWRARRASSIASAPRKNAARWLALSALGGLIFLAIQSYEYHALITSGGMRMPGNLFDATFFMLTGFHGMHVLAGVLYLGACSISLRASKEFKRLTGWVTIVAISAAVALGLFALFSGVLRLGLLTASVTAIGYGLFFLASLIGIPWLERRNSLAGVIRPAALYWQFVDAVWIVLFLMIYLF
jgi:heme/copper-type cytochrome/quinol oxidase subunit 3